jgi:Asp-tRNA(Asn)/Glu-tRNA(Gln) amidotransferase A subunit family amidase
MIPWIVIIRVSFSSFKWLLFGKKQKEVSPLSSPRLFLMHPAISESAYLVASKLRRGVYSSKELFRVFISLLFRLNKQLNCVTAYRLEDGLAEAILADEKLDEARKSGTLDQLPLFLGVPCCVKESFAVQGMVNSSGFYFRKNLIASFDATAVEKYKKNGLIICCTTNASELGLWYESSNTLFGISNNPFSTLHTTGGSSGGDAAIVSCGFPCGLGADVGGSLRMPAAFCGIFSLKPTGGLISNFGLYPFSPNRFLCTGPFCKYIDDIPHFFELLLGLDEKDPASGVVELLDVDLPLPMNNIVDALYFNRGFDTDESSISLVDRTSPPLTTPRIDVEDEGGILTHGPLTSTSEASSFHTTVDGFVAQKLPFTQDSLILYKPKRGSLLYKPLRSWNEVNIYQIKDLQQNAPFFTTSIEPSITSAISIAVSTLTSRYGANGPLFFDMPELKYAFEGWSAVLHASNQPSFVELLQDGYGKEFDVAVELLKWCFSSSTSTLPALILALIEKPSATLFPVRQKRLVHMVDDLKERINRQLAETRGVLLMPCHPTTAPLHDLAWVRPFNFSYTALLNVLEVPVVVVPMGLDGRGLPVAIQVIAAKGCDRLCIAVAQALERAGVAGWIPPPLMHY